MPSSAPSYSSKLEVDKWLQLPANKLARERPDDEHVAVLYEAWHRQLCAVHQRGGLHLLAVCALVLRRDAQSAGKRVEQAM